jgi:hypothetical protein
MHRSGPEDSPHESSVIADGYEQLDTDERQDSETAPPRETRPPSPPTFGETGQTCRLALTRYARLGRAQIHRLELDGLGSCETV